MVFMLLDVAEVRTTVDQCIVATPPHMVEHQKTRAADRHPVYASVRHVILVQLNVEAIAWTDNGQDTAFACSTCGSVACRQKSLRNIITSEVDIYLRCVREGL